MGRGGNNEEGILKTYEEKLKWTIERLAKDLSYDCDEATTPANSCFECDDLERDMCGTGIALRFLNKLVETTLNETNPPACVLRYHNGRVYGFCPRCGRGVESGCDCGFCGLEIDWKEEE